MSVADSRTRPTCATPRRAHDEPDCQGAPWPQAFTKQALPIMIAVNPRLEKRIIRGVAAGAVTG